jgi:hypothetical protein
VPDPAIHGYWHRDSARGARGAWLVGVVLRPLAGGGKCRNRMAAAWAGYGLRAHVVCAGRAFYQRCGWLFRQGFAAWACLFERGKDVAALRAFRRLLSRLVHGFIVLLLWRVSVAIASVRVNSADIVEDCAWSGRRAVKRVGFSGLSAGVGGVRRFGRTALTSNRKRERAWRL